MKTTDLLPKSALRPYQNDLITHLYEHDGTLARLPMGAGKTVCTLTAIKELIDDGVLNKVLVVAPLRVATLVWKQEAARWEHLAGMKVAIACGNEKQRLKGLAEYPDVLTINIENLPWFVSNGHLKYFDGIVFDEITKFKAPTGKRLKAIEKDVSQIGWRVGLTGSIRPQDLQDVFAPMKLVTNDRPLGKNITAFRKSFMIRDPYVTGRYHAIPGMEETVAKKMSKWVYQIPEEDYLDQLPELNIVRVPVVMPKKAVDVYKKMKFEYMAEDVEALSAASMVLKLQQITSGFMYGPDNTVVKVHDAKQEALRELCNETTGNILIAYWFQEDLRLIKQVLGCHHLGSGVNQKKADSIVTEWNAGNIKELAVHPASVGHGLNLQDGGNTIIWFTGVYSFELHEQLIARLRRSGQSSGHVTSMHLIAAEIDDVVLQTALGKGDIQDNFVRFLDA